MLHKKLAFTLSILLGAALPVQAETGMSELIKPGHPDFPTGQPTHLSGMLSIDGTADGAPAQQMQFNYQPDMSQYGMLESAAQHQPPPMQYGMLQSAVQQQSPPMPYGMNQMPQAPYPTNQAQYGMNQMPYGTNQSPYDSGQMGAMQQSPLGDGMSQAMTAAATIGLLGSSAMNMLGDSLKGMGFSGGFQGRAASRCKYNLTPGGRTDLRNGGVGFGDNYQSTGGDGGVTGLERTINRAVDRNINYAADQATRRLINGLF